jgi:hypothetical protein
VIDNVHEFVGRRRLQEKKFMHEGIPQVLDQARPAYLLYCLSTQLAIQERREREQHVYALGFLSGDHPREI